MHNVLATLDGQPLLLAQPDVQTTETTGATDAAGGDGATTEPQGFNPMSMMLIFGAVILFMFMLGGGGARKQRKKQKEMLDQLKKGDRIITIGKIKGSVVEVRDDEVVIKVDENNNTRMKISRDGIGAVLDAKDTMDAKDTRDEK